jgi:hypothetical protein
MAAPVVSGTARLEDLFERAAQDELEFDNRTFRYRGRVVPGLLNPLRKALWPRYKYDAANDRAAARFTKRDRSLRQPSDGRRRGSRVHKQIEMLTNYGTSAVRRSRHRIDDYTRKFCVALAAWKWRPVRAELPLYDPDVDIATKADLLCVDAQDRVVLVEIKTGYYASWNRGCHEMSGPLQRAMSDSPCNQSLMQLLFTKRMVENAYATPVERAYVVRIDPDGVTPTRLPRELERDGPMLAAYVSETRQKKKKR